MLQRKDVAPDFKVGEGSLYQALAERAVVVFFYPKDQYRRANKSGNRYCCLSGGRNKAQ